MPQSWSALFGQDREPGRRIEAAAGKRESAVSAKLAPANGTVGILAGLIIDLSVTLLAFALGAAFSMLFG
jgi:hypothetical protein